MSLAILIKNPIFRKSYTNVKSLYWIDQQYGSLEKLSTMRFFGRFFWYSTIELFPAEINFVIQQKKNLDRSNALCRKIYSFVFWLKKLPQQIITAYNQVVSFDASPKWYNRFHYHLSTWFSGFILIECKTKNTFSSR